MNNFFASPFIKCSVMLVLFFIIKLFKKLSKTYKSEPLIPNLNYYIAVKFKKEKKFSHI